MGKVEYYSLLFAWMCYCHMEKWDACRLIHFFMAIQSYAKLIVARVVQETQINAIPICHLLAGMSQVQLPTKYSAHSVASHRLPSVDP